MTAHADLHTDSHAAHQDGGPAGSDSIPHSSSSTSPSPEQSAPDGQNASVSDANRGAAPPHDPRGVLFSEKERKALFLNVIVGIVLLEFAVTVGAVVYCITNAEKTASGMLRFNFPWLGYLITATLTPVLVMLILHMVSLGFSRAMGRDGDMSDVGSEAVGGRAASFFALVRGAPTIILFAGFVLMGAAVYYLDGVMALLLKLGDSFQTVAVWLVGALGVAFCVNAVARAVLTYKTRQLEAEYAFRREVFERTGTILMSSRQVALPSGTVISGTPASEQTQSLLLEIESKPARQDSGETDVVDVPDPNRNL